MYRKRSASDIVKADHLRHMVYILQLFCHFDDIRAIHAITDEHAVRALAKFIQQDILPFHSLNVIRQIIQNIVIYLSSDKSDGRRHHERHRQDQDENPELHDDF